MTVQQASAALALSIMLQISAWTQSVEKGASLRVRVTDSQTKVIPKARVIARPAAGGPSVEADVDAEGIAQFRPPTQGTYVISAKAEGFTDTSRFIDWNQESVTIDVTLDVGGLREQVTVTSGSRIEELQQDSPVKVEVVTREAMINTGYERLSDVLSEIPGVVTRSGSSGAVSAEQIRGISSRQVAGITGRTPDDWRARHQERQRQSESPVNSPAGSCRSG